MHWAIIDTNYVNYLSQFDNKVGKVNYNNRLKLHIGILFTINSHNFYVPISSAKPKHAKMKNSLDFHKIQDETQCYAVLNLNNMIPVPNRYVTLLTYNQIDQYRFFSSLKEKNDYIYLLQKEMNIILSIESTIKHKAEKLYRTCSNYPTSHIAQRCCNFHLLEIKSLLFEN